MKLNGMKRKKDR